MPKPPSAARQRGSILLYSLVALLLMFLGVLFAMRGSLNDTALTDHYSQRQKNVQASDLALQAIISSDLQPYAAAATELEVAASGQSWFFNAQPAQMVGSANASSYWCSCMAASAGTSTTGCGWGGTTTPTCAALPKLAGGQTAWFFVQPTGRSDGSGCGTSGMTAVYYDIWIHTADPRSQVWADTESVYRLCVSS